MEVIYKIRSDSVETLHKGKDFTEEEHKILFNDGTYIYKVQLSEILVDAKGKCVMYTYCEDALFEFQRELKYFD